MVVSQMSQEALSLAQTRAKIKNKSRTLLATPAHIAVRQTG